MDPLLRLQMSMNPEALAAHGLFQSHPGLASVQQAAAAAAMAASGGHPGGAEAAAAAAAAAMGLPPGAQFDPAMMHAAAVAAASANHSMMQQAQAQQQAQQAQQSGGGGNGSYPSRPPSIMPRPGDAGGLQAAAMAQQSLFRSFEDQLSHQVSVFGSD